MEEAQAQAALGGQGPHVERFGQCERLAVGSLCRWTVGSLAGGGDVGEEKVGIGLLSSLLALARQIEGTPGVIEGEITLTQEQARPACARPRARRAR